MTIEEAKSIRIADYLYSLGYSPVKQQGINLWYKSPFREESEASFKVNTEREQWYDFGLGKGGNIIALAAHLYATDHIPYILKRIAEQTPHVRPVSFSFGKQNSSEPSFQQLEIVPLSSTALLAYLQGRGINIKLAKRECSEARFTHNGKRYFAIAFPNGSCGYEIRNRYFKGCIAPKEISHIRQVVRARENKKIFLWIYERNGYVNLNVKADPEWRDFWRSAYESVQAGYHQNKEHWNTIILNGTVPDKDIKRMISESYDLVTYSPTKKIYEAVKQIPKGCVATYGQVAEMAGNPRMSRAVGNALHKNPDPEHIPCYRVVNSRGELSGAFAFGGKDVQKKLLEADGIEVVNGTVDLKKYGLTQRDDKR